MRWLVTGIAFFILVLPTFGQENEAEKLFRAMENKVRAVKALKMLCELEGTIDGSGTPIKVIASQQFAGTNKARFELQVETGGNTSKRLQVSDGKHMLIRDSFLAESGPEPADPNLNKTVPMAIARAGFMLPRLVRPDVGGFDVDRLLPASHFKLGAKERVGKVEAQAVEYSVTFGGSSSAFGNCKKVQVTVWIDPKTMIPLKRKVTDHDHRDHYFVEVYKEFVLDPQLDAKIFELPK